MLNQGKVFDAFIQKLTPESRPPEGLHRETVARGNRGMRDGVMELEQDGITKNLQRFRPEETKVRFDSIEDTTFKGKIVEAQVVYNEGATMSCYRWWRTEILVPGIRNGGSTIM